MNTLAFLVPLALLLGFVLGWLRFSKPWMEDELRQAEEFIQWQRQRLTDWAEHSRRWAEICAAYRQQLDRSRTESNDDTAADWWKQ